MIKPSSIIVNLELNSKEPLTNIAQTIVVDETLVDAAVLTIHCKINEDDTGFEHNSLLFTRDDEDIYEEAEWNGKNSLIYHYLPYSAKQDHIQNQTTALPITPGTVDEGEDYKQDLLVESTEEQSHLPDIIRFDCSALRKSSKGSKSSGKFHHRSVKLAVSRNQFGRRDADAASSSSWNEPKLPYNSERCEHNHCKNNGVCVNQRDDPGAPYCVCVNGFSGQACERLDGVLKDSERRDASLLYGSVLMFLIFFALFGVVFGRWRTKRLDYTKVSKMHSDVGSIVSSTLSNQFVQNCASLYEKKDGAKDVGTKTLLIPVDTSGNEKSKQVISIDMIEGESDNYRIIPDLENHGILSDTAHRCPFPSSECNSHASCLVPATN